MTMNGEAALLADIGGTNARFALLRDGEPGPVTRLKVADYPDPIQAIQAFFEQASPGTEVRRAAIAVAGPVMGESARLTNATWRFSVPEIREALGFSRVGLINDFAAVALALPHLRASDVEKIGGGRGAPGAARAVLGPGTGLGVAALLSQNGKPVVLASEGGHATLTAQDAREAEVLAHLRAARQHVAAEDVLSGPGLVRLYRTLAVLDGLDAPARSPEEIVDAALAESCAASAAALELFCGWLGRFAGDLALIFGAQGGVYIAGGIVPPFADYLKRSRFRPCFEDKGAFRDYAAKIPTFVITHPDPAFVGLADLVAGF